MSKKNQGSNQKLASLIAVVAVLGFIGSYTPSLLNYWEETWYPHGRERHVINPGLQAEPFVLGFPAERSAPDHAERGVENWNVFHPKQLPTPPLAKADEETCNMCEV